MKNFFYTSVAIASITVSVGALAQQKPDSAFSISGFGTIGAVRTNTDDGEFATPGQVAGATTAPTIGVDSKLGIQANGTLNDQVSGTIQLVSKYNGQGNYRPEVEWAFARLAVTPALSLRVGRMGLPAFTVSDFRDVNFANLWIRPPLDVYGVLPVSHFDGADVIHTLQLGHSTITTQVYGGRADAHYQDAKVKIDSLIGINSTVEFDNGLAIRVGHFQSNLGVEAGGQTPNDKRTRFSGVGLSYDKNDLVVNTEYVWGKRRADTAAISPTGWYASLGYRLGKFTPFAVTSRFKLALDQRLPDGSTFGLNAGQKTNSVGVRWDVWKNADLKLQWDRISVGNHGGQFVAPQPSLDGAKVNALGVAADFVF